MRFLNYSDLTKADVVHDMLGIDMDTAISMVVDLVVLMADYPKDNPPSGGFLLSWVLGYMLASDQIEASIRVQEWWREYDMGLLCVVHDTIEMRLD